jgi:hypothetical protein
MQPPTSLDIMTVLSALLAVLVGPQLAPLLSAYAIIFMGWGVGLIVGLITRPPASRVSTLVYALVSFVVVFVMTAKLADAVEPATSLVSQWVKLDAPGLLFPIAAILTGVGERWWPVLTWLWKRLAPASLQAQKGSNDVQ